MSHRCLASVLTAIAVVALAAIPVAAQTAPRTAWGQPDLQGIWDFRTITPIERPEELGNQEFLTEEEAASLFSGSSVVTAPDLQFCTCTFPASLP